MLATREKKYKDRFEFVVREEPLFDVAVIGAGASGALVAAQFRRLAPRHGRLALVGAGSGLARGIAYQTPYASHLLNVRAGNMSAFPDDMDHFLRWLGRRMPEAHAKTFAPRSLYGEYLFNLLNTPANGFASVVPMDGTAVDVTRRGEGWTVHLQDGSSFQSKVVVLALGNLPPADHAVLKGRSIRSYRPNPWAADVARGLAPEAPVLLIGTGLTMVDVVLALREEGHRGRIHAISRHGRLPQEHSDFVRRPMPTKLPGGLDSPVKAMRWLRDEVKTAQSQGFDWRAVIDGIRPHTAAIWRSWSLKQRASFLRHARNLWDVHRHRTAPEIFAQIEKLIAQGTLSVQRGQIISLNQMGEGVDVGWRPIGSDKSLSIEVACVINCTGPARDYAQADSPLVRSLRKSGRLTPDSLRLGIETDEQGRLLGKDGCVVEGLYTLGPLRLPGLWESIAIPEIRSQAAMLVKQLISESFGVAIPIR